MPQQSSTHRIRVSPAAANAALLQQLNWSDTQDYENVKAVYQHYLGFFDGNPANLHPLPPEAAGKRYVEFMGGADNLLTQARASFEKGEYRWVAQVVNHLVFADPDNQAARAQRGCQRHPCHSERSEESSLRRMEDPSLRSG
ncbi:hypothetical protein A9Q02_21710 [Candidatus Chloroploca asiatica]|uniref:Alkyl sulfatase dimerisation domain-containing protein n=1 Tax=Candidatus Chloroploca asiatica TaxID=1506545 RepID=A0A2H3LAP4_9CHLR|nr:alkyl sulfatase dimerization domain-containing protein [Candidatus Chloroploca asiatica]PDW00519.1 hypothetical protein A9Q02_21710 [Candidatus Chloroploca asiatica]